MGIPTRQRIQELLREIHTMENQLEEYRENPNTSPLWATLVLEKAKLTLLLGDAYERNQDTQSKKP